MSAKLQIAGQRFCKLTALCFHSMSACGKSKWLFKCDCGTDKVIDAASVKSGLVRSCGCIQKLPKGESGFNDLFYNYRYSAKNRGFSFLLTKKQFRKLTKKSCFYCGTPPRAISKRRNEYSSYIYNGVDRKKNSIGYSCKNCVSCCRTCNFAKFRMSTKEFLQWIKTIVRFQTLKGTVKSVGKN